MSEELKKARAAAIRSRIIKWTVCIGCGLLPALLTWWASDFELDELGGPIMIFLILYGLASMLWATFSKNRAVAYFQSIYKQEMIHVAIGDSKLYDEMDFQPFSGLNPQAVRESGLLTTSRFSSDCCIQGKHNGVPFICADIRNVVGQKNQGYHVEYDGTFYIFSVKLPDAAQTNIYNKDVDINLILPGKNFVPTGSPAFNQLFKISTNNQQAAAALITPDFMNKLLMLQNKMNGRIALSVKNGQMYLFISKHKSVLKPSYSKEYDSSMNAAIIEELSRIKLFIEAFSI
uniref:DUF3137 domain-containing protein n=1 Tax=Acetatifactor sp. TaxID=1872090 RepID=UPI00405731A5